MVRLSIGSPPDPAVLAQAADVMWRGGVVAIPTDTVYGLAADPFNAEGIRRVFKVKGRGAEKALPLIAASLAQVELVGILSPEAKRLAARFWPGPLTLVIEVTARFPDILTGGTRGIAVRVPSHDVARALCAECGHPLIATSANRSGHPPSPLPDEVARALGDDLDALLDNGVTPGGAVSTIVDMTGEQPVLIRQGAIEWETIKACLDR